MKRFVVLAVAMLLSCAAAFAQSQKLIEKQFESFNTIKVEDKFIVKLIHADSFSVRIVSDERISAHVQAYVKNGILYLVLDEKGYPSELKKALRKKGEAKPVLEAEVYAPHFNSLILNGKALLTHCDEFNVNSFNLTVSGDAKVQQLNVVCENADLAISKSATVIGRFEIANKLHLATSNSSQVTLTQNGGDMVCDLNGSSLVDARTTVQHLQINANGSAESHFSGNASYITVQASGLSRTNTELLESPKGAVTQTGTSKCYVNVTDKLIVNLVGGSMLTFKNFPSIEVERIYNSTLIKSDDPKRK